ncbi:hypothetical protein GQ44DRAFT_271335 [Phaeosphaeriaceae sp. PMI808]|nr:hypothetical protein GQ44DRAFT_271335 [Phaeosphaeriaceae sp. PMI808]
MQEQNKDNEYPEYTNGQTNRAITTNRENLIWPPQIHPYFPPQQLLSQPPLAHSVLRNDARLTTVPTTPYHHHFPAYSHVTPIPMGHYTPYLQQQPQYVPPLNIYSIDDQMLFSQLPQTPQHGFQHNPSDLVNHSLMPSSQPIDGPESNRSLEVWDHTRHSLNDARTDSAINSTPYTTTQGHIPTNPNIRPHRPVRPKKLRVVPPTRTETFPTIPRTPAKSSITCPEPGCPASFTRHTDLRRHTQSFHKGADSHLWCPAPHCPRSQSYGDRPYPKARRDKLNEHIGKMHDSEQDRALWPLWARQIDSACGRKRSRHDGDDIQLYVTERTW